jgi:hypothetical protein
VAVATIRAMNETLGESLRLRLGRTLVALDRLRPAPTALRPVPLTVPMRIRHMSAMPRYSIRPIRPWDRLIRI